MAYPKDFAPDTFFNGSPCNDMAASGALMILKTWWVIDPVPFMKMKARPAAFGKPADMKAVPEGVPGKN